MTKNTSSPTYFRQRSAHLKQSAYRVRLAKGAHETLERRTIDYIGKTFTIDEIDRILHATINKCGNEVEFAVHLAQRLRKHVTALSEAMEALHGLPPVR